MINRSDIFSIYAHSKVWNAHSGGFSIYGVVADLFDNLSKFRKIEVILLPDRNFERSIFEMMIHIFVSSNPSGMVCTIYHIHICCHWLHNKDCKFMIYFVFFKKQKKQQKVARVKIFLGGSNIDSMVSMSIMMISGTDPIYPTDIRASFPLTAFF